MARMAASSEAPRDSRTANARAVSAAWPCRTTDSTTRDAAASAGAPGAQGVLAKAAAREGETMGEIPRCDGSAAGTLDLGDCETAPAALYHNGLLKNPHDRTGIEADRR